MNRLFRLDLKLKQLRAALHGRVYCFNFQMPYLLGFPGKLNHGVSMAHSGGNIVVLTPDREPTFGDFMQNKKYVKFNHTICSRKTSDRLYSGIVPSPRHCLKWGKPVGPVFGSMWDLYWDFRYTPSVVARGKLVAQRPVPCPANVWFSYVSPSGNMGGTLTEPRFSELKDLALPLIQRIPTLEREEHWALYWDSQYVEAGLHDGIAEKF